LNVYFNEIMMKIFAGESPKLGSEIKVKYFDSTTMLLLYYIVIIFCVCWTVSAVRLPTWLSKR